MRLIPDDLIAQHPPGPSLGQVLLTGASRSQTQGNVAHTSVSPYRGNVVPAEPKEQVSFRIHLV